MAIRDTPSLYREPQRPQGAGSNECEGRAEHREPPVFERRLAGKATRDVLGVSGFGDTQSPDSFRGAGLSVWAINPLKVVACASTRWNESTRRANSPIRLGCSQLP